MTDDAETAWDEQQAVTGRPNDVPDENSTLSSRAKARTKQVKTGEDKSVKTSPAKKRASGS